MDTKYQIAAGLTTAIAGTLLLWYLTRPAPSKRRKRRELSPVEECVSGFKPRPSAEEIKSGNEYRSDRTVETRVSEGGVVMQEVHYGARDIRYMENGEVREIPVQEMDIREDVAEERAREEPFVSENPQHFVPEANHASAVAPAELAPRLEEDAPHTNGVVEMEEENLDGMEDMPQIREEDVPVLSEVRQNTVQSMPPPLIQSTPPPLIPCKSAHTPTKPTYGGSPAHTKPAYGGMSMPAAEESVYETPSTSPYSTPQRDTTPQRDSATPQRDTPQRDTTPQQQSRDTTPQHQPPNGGILDQLEQSAPQQQGNRGSIYASQEIIQQLFNIPTKAVGRSKTPKFGVIFHPSSSDN